MNYVIHVKYSTLHRQFLQVFTIEPRLNHMKDCIAGRCRQLLTIFKAEPFKSPLTLSTAWQKRVAVRVQPVLPHLVDLQSAFEVRQLGTLRTIPRSGLLFVAELQCLDESCSARERALARGGLLFVAELQCLGESCSARERALGRVLAR